MANKYIKPNRSKLVFGVGVNDVLIPGFSKTKIYRKWVDLIRRCHDPRWWVKWPGYRDCTMAEEWLYLSNFKEWVETWDDWETKELDKDVLIPGNKHYGPQTCLMVNRYINGGFRPSDVEGCKGDTSLPRGVSRKNGKYRAQINIIGGRKRQHLGLFDTPEQASVVFEQARKEQIKVLLDQETDKRVINALRQYLR
ncbi:MAG: hypothetical protein ACO3CD_06115 [Candidatus Nanopelagicaceae bacterium]